MVLVQGAVVAFCGQWGAARFGGDRKLTIATVGVPIVSLLGSWIFHYRGALRMGALLGQCALVAVTNDIAIVATLYFTEKGLFDRQASLPAQDTTHSIVVQGYPPGS